MMVTTACSHPALRHFLLWVVAIGVCSVQSDGQGISVSPSRLFFTGSPGERVLQVIKVENPSDMPMVMSVIIRDFVRDSLGEKVYSPASDQPGSNAKWVELSSNTLELAPHEKKDFPVFLQIPANRSLSQRGVSRSMLFLSQVNEQKTTPGQQTERSMGIHVRLEMAVHVYYTPDHCSRRDLEFVSFDDRGPAPSSKDSLRRFAITIRNDGDVSTDAAVRMELTEKDTGKEIPIPEKRISMLPGALQIVYLDIPVVKGQYLAIAMLDTGDQNDLKVAEKNVAY